MAARSPDLHDRIVVERGWDELVVDDPADHRVVLAVGIVAVLVDLAVRAGGAGSAGALAIVAVSTLLLLSGRLDTRQSRVLVALAALFGAWLGIRASPWLLIPDILTAGALLVFGVSFARRGDVFDLRVPDLLMRSVHALGHGLAGPAFAWQPVKARRATSARAGPTGAFVRGALIALPLVAVLGALLASADAVFASVFRIDVNVDDAVAHCFALVVGGWAMAGLLRVASARAPDAPVGPRPRLGRVEATVVLVALDALFAVFVIVQLVAATGGADHVLETAGLTYAEYARSGFFQLLWVAALTLASLLALRAATDLSDARVRRRFVLLAEVAVVLTLVIVGTAIRRLALYEDVFGLTMLRLYSQVFAVWIAIVFLLLAARLAGVQARRAWLPAVAAGTGLLTLLGLNVVNPEAIVARHNVDRAVAGARFDPDYLVQLSDDAVPTVAAALPRLRGDQRQDARRAVCETSDAHRQFRGWAAYSRSRADADRARRARCTERNAAAGSR